MALNYILQSLSLNVIEKLLSAMTDLGEKQLLPGGEMHGQVARLQQNLADIKDFFAKIENEGSGIDQNESFQTWLWQFRDAAEEAEDVLDELEYNEIEKKVQADDDDKVSGTLSRYKRKFTDFIAGPFKDETLKRLKEAVKELDNVAAGMDDFLLLARGINWVDGKNWKLMKSPETSAFLTESKVFGREKEKKQLINWLTELNASSVESTDANLSAFTIVGLGGMGKTTLAQNIYGDERVRGHFELLMWVHVSNNFDTIIITRNILEAAGVLGRSQNLDELQEALREKLESKRFLLILDDVWNDSERSEWDKLIKPLKFGQKGSKILVTSRMQSVADMVSQQTNQEIEFLKLDGLEENDYILLFNSHAFAGVDPEKHKDLQLIGRQIAKKLGGCPLTAKVLGGQLNWYMDEYYWEKILKEDIINIDQGENGIMAILKLSYNHLPTCLQLCFRYCAIFPENYVFHKDELIYMWLNSGLIQNAIEKPEEVGSDYFSHLLKRSFFEFKMSYDNSTGSTQIGDHKKANILGKGIDPFLINSSFYFKDTYYDSASYYVIHDLLRDLARSVSSEECRSIQVNDFQCLPKTLRHIYLFTEVTNDSLLQEILPLRHLRSLVIVFKGSDPVQNKIHVQMLSGILDGSKSLRLLSITTNFSCKLPNAVGNLIHLRHLSIRQITADSKLNWFPETVCKLYNLRVMSLLGESESDYDYAEINANGLNNLTNLRQLRIPDPIIIKIPHIGKLRTLQGSVAFDVREESGYSISELKTMADISLLSIGSLENVRNAKEAYTAKLVEKKNLRSLSLFWSRNSSRSPKRDEQLIDNLEPCAKLVDLAIQGYNGIRSPSWMADLSIFNLTSISLIDCIKWEYLPGLGKLPNLKVLELNRLWAVEKIDGTFYGKEDGVSFPSLKELRFDDMLRWELWFCLNYGLPFPQLDTLTLEKCPKLREFPPLPPSTNRFHINDVGLVSLSALYRVSSFSKDAVSSLSSVLSKSLVPQQKGEFSLEVLSIKRCENLMHLPLEGFRKLKSLRSLLIGKCPNLEACGSDTLLPSSLNELCIGNCGDLEEPLASSIQSATCLIRLSLEGCAKITTLPPAEVFSKLTALKWLEIKNCKELVSLGGINAIALLDNLEIFGCEKLALGSLSESLLACDVSHEKTVESSSLKVSLLDIDKQSILLTEQLCHVSSVREVEIVETLAYLPEQLFLHNSATLQKVVISNASSLESVPLRIASLNQLQVLTICDVPKIKSLPDLPISVERVHICGCHPALEQHYNNSIDLVWNVLKENIEVLRRPCGYEPGFLQDLDFESEEEEEEEGEGEGEEEEEEEEDEEDEEEEEEEEEENIVVKSWK